MSFIRGDSTNRCPLLIAPPVAERPGYHQLTTAPNVVGVLIECATDTAAAGFDQIDQVLLIGPVDADDHDRALGGRWKRCGRCGRSLRLRMRRCQDVVSRKDAKLEHDTQALKQRKPDRSRRQNIGVRSDSLSFRAPRPTRSSPWNRRAIRVGIRGRAMRVLPISECPAPPPPSQHKTKNRARLIALRSSGRRDRLQCPTPAATAISHPQGNAKRVGRRGEAPLVPPYVPFSTGC